MSLVLYKTCYNYAEGLVTFSALEAGGFSPTFGNIHYLTQAIWEIDALGGMQILLPEPEVNDANAWLVHLQQQAIKDYDKIERPKYGKWFRATSMLCIYNLLSLGFFLPILFLNPLVLFVIAFVIAALTTAYYGVLGLVSFSILFFPLLLLHAKYVAGPKFVKGDNAHVA